MKVQNKVLVVTGGGSSIGRVLVGSDSKFMDRLYRLNPTYAAGLIYKKMKALLGE